VQGLASAGASMSFFSILCSMSVACRACVAPDCPIRIQHLIAHIMRGSFRSDTTLHKGLVSCEPRCCMYVTHDVAAKRVVSVALRECCVAMRAQFCVLFARGTCLTVAGFAECASLFCWGGVPGATAGVQLLRHPAAIPAVWQALQGVPLCFVGVCSRVCCVP
jgi:hypothetical protein